ncbi:MAG: hypothetical protein ACFFD4_11955 [Candidatus Odinarchaeota archaeon]
MLSGRPIELEISAEEINNEFEEFEQCEMAVLARKGFKFVLAGDGAVGKTALKERFVKKSLQDITWRQLGLNSLQQLSKLPIKT